MSQYGPLSCSLLRVPAPRLSLLPLIGQGLQPQVRVDDMVRQFLAIGGRGFDGVVLIRTARGSVRAVRMRKASVVVGQLGASCQLVSRPSLS
jgi:hypothetical protein